MERRRQASDSQDSLMRYVVYLFPIAAHKLCSIKNANLPWLA